MSAPPPGENGITIRTGRDGQACPAPVEVACAAASGAKASVTAAPTTALIIRRLTYFTPH